MPYNPEDPNTWNDPAGNTADQGFVNTAIQDMGYGQEDTQTQSVITDGGNTYNPVTKQYTSTAWGNDVLNLDWSNSDKPVFNMANGDKPSPATLALTKGGEDSWYKPVIESLSKMMQTNGGEIFAKTMSGAAAGVLNFLAARRKARGDLEVLDRTHQYNTQTANAKVARASAMPTVGSMVKPGVTGQRKVGNRQAIAPAPQYTGLINAPRF